MWRNFGTITLAHFKVKMWMLIPHEVDMMEPGIDRIDVFGPEF